MKIRKIGLALSGSLFILCLLCCNKQLKIVQNNTPAKNGLVYDKYWGVWVDIDFSKGFEYFSSVNNTNYYFRGDTIVAVKRHKINDSTFYDPIRKVKGRSFKGMSFGIPNDTLKKDSIK